jgi:hypothetical protein
VTIERPTGRHVVIVKRGNEVLIGEAVILDSTKPYRFGVRIEGAAPTRPEDAPSTADRVGPMSASVGEPPASGSAREGWVRLFNGRDKTHWVEGRGNQGTWKVADGVLEGRGGDDLRQTAMLQTKRTDYSDFRLRARVLHVGRGGRIKVRMVAGDDPALVRDGYGIRVGATRPAIGDRIPLGSIQEDTGRPRKSRIDWDVLAEELPVEPGSWYTLEISVIGNRISTSVNGKRVAEFVDESNPVLAGRIGLFCRAREAIRFQEISILELPAASVPNLFLPRGSRTEKP